MWTDSIKELGCINHVVDGVFIPVLRVSQKLNQVTKRGDDAYNNVVDNIANILTSKWMCALADELRPYSLVEVIALLLVGAMANYNGAREALAKVVTLPWVRQLFALHAGRPSFDRLRRIVRENLSREHFEDATVTAEVCATAAALSGARAQIEAGGIVSDVAVRPAGVTQMLFCAALALCGARGSVAEFPAKAAQVIVSCNSAAETTVLARMLLKCYDDEAARGMAAADVAHCAAQAMQESAQVFVAGITAQTDAHDDVNQERAAEWLAADAARRAMLAIVVPSVPQPTAAALAAQVAVQTDAMAENLAQAGAQRRVPRYGSPMGDATAEAVDARTRLMLTCAKAAPDAFDRGAVAGATARLLAATAYMLPPNAIEAIVDLLDTCVSKDEALAAQVRELIAPARRFLETSQWEAVGRATGEHIVHHSLHRPVAARGADGELVDNWVLLEGYGRRVGEEPAIPPEAFVKQSQQATKQSVRLKRTYSTFACLVR